MLFLATHAQRRGTPDPLHTREGLKMLRSNIVWDTMSIVRQNKKIKGIFSGSGGRFRESCLSFRELLAPLEIEYLPIFGTGDSETIDGSGKKIVVTADGDIIFKKQYRNFYDIKGIDWWRVLQDNFDNSIIFTGRAFCKCIGLKSKTCSIYQVDTDRRLVIAVVESGYWVLRPKRIYPLKI